MDREKKERMRKKGWVSYRISPRIEHEKQQTVEILQKEVHFQQHGKFPAICSAQLLFFRESKLYLDITIRPGKVGISGDKDP